MEESEILDQLRDPSYVTHRSFLLDKLSSRVQRNVGQVAVEDRQDLFLSLAHALEDYDEEVRQKAIDIVCTVMPHVTQLDKCMDYVLPQVIYNIGDKKPHLRKSVIQTLHQYMSKTSNLQHVFQAVIKYGMENADPEINMQTLVSLPILLTTEVASADLSPIVKSLVKKVCRAGEDKIVGTSAVALHEIRLKVGEERFNVLTEKLPSDLKERYRAIGEQQELDINSNKQEKLNSQAHAEINGSKHEDDQYFQGESNDHRFGIIPETVMQGLLNERDWYERLSAAEELKQLISRLDNTSLLKHNFLALISFLCHLLEDYNFKVSLVAIEIFEELVVKLDQDIKHYLKPVVSALTKRFGDNKIVIRQANMSVMKTLMQTVEPKPVVDVVSESVRHKKSGIREEALHIIIVALLTFPSNDFDLPKLCHCVAPRLGDPKRKVRQAALETFAVLAQAMGPSKIGPLIRAVDEVELQMNDEGVMKAVQARLARRQLPKINSDGMVELPSPHQPSSASSRSSPAVGFDTVWVLQAAGNTGSAKDRSHTDPAIDLSQTLPNEATASNSTLHDVVPPKRSYSAGRGKSKLPWEENRDHRMEPDTTSLKMYNGAMAARSQLNSAPPQEKSAEAEPPLEARQTWNSSDPNLWQSSTKERRQRPNFLADKQDLTRESETFGGSYRQKHVDKMKMRALAPVKNDADSDKHHSGSHSAPVSDRVDFPLLDTRLTWTSVYPDNMDDLAGSDPFVLGAPVLTKKRDENRMMEMWNEKRIIYDAKQRDGPRRPKELAGLSRTSPRRSFSNSWPETSLVDEGMSPRRNAISNTPKRSAGRYASIPQKPTLARSASRSHSKDNSPREELIDLDFVDDSTPQSPTHSDEDVGNEDYLQSVRSSAQKKRAQKHSRSNSKSSPSHQRNHSSTSSVLHDSAFFDGPLSRAGDETSSARTEVVLKPVVSPRKESLQDSPFSSKPRIARSSAGRRKTSAEATERKVDLAPDFNPSGGVTFRENKTADVTVVGRGYNGQSGNEDGAQIVDDALAAVLSGRHQNARERRRQKGSVSSSVNIPSVRDLLEPDREGWIGDTAVRVRGVFGSTAPDPLFTSTRSPGREEPAEPVSREAPEVIGHSYQQGRMEETERSDDEGLGTSMSRTVMDKITQKQVKMQKTRKTSRGTTNREDDDHDRMKETNHWMNETFPRTPERGKRGAHPAREGFHSDSEEERRRLADEAERTYEVEILQEREFRLQEERKRGEADAKRVSDAEEIRRSEVEEYRRMEEEERRIQVQERMEAQRLTEERRIEEEQRAPEERRVAKEQRAAEERGVAKEQRLSDERRHAKERRRRISQEEKVPREQELADERRAGTGLRDLDDRLGAEEEDLRRVRAEEDKYATEEFEVDQIITDASSVEQAFPKSSQRPPPAAKRKKTKSPKSPGARALSQSMSAEPELPPDSDDRSDDMKPLPNPSTALREALKCLEQDEDWEVKNEGLNLIRRLSLYHTHEIGPQLHTVVMAVLAEVKNLRSNVSKCAIVCLGDMFEALNVALDKELDQICRVILPKAQESSTFIRNSLDATLMSMVHNVSPQRALSAIISVGASHNSKVVRKTAAQFLEEIVRKMGPGKILSGVKDVTDKVLPTIAKLAQDPDQNTRYNARKTVLLLMQHEDFAKQTERHVPSKNLKSFQEVVANLRTKGLAEPGDSLSAKGSRRSLPNSRASSNSHIREKPPIANGSANRERTRSGSFRKKRSSARSEGQQECVADLVNSLTSSDWRVKISAIETFQDLCVTNPVMVNHNIMKIFDGFSPRLADSNSKVCSVALETMKQVIPHIAEGMPDVIADVVSKLVKSLASKNSNIQRNSNEIFESLMDHVDNSLLVQPFSVATKCANARVKPPMLEKLTRLVAAVYPKKPQLVSRQILPVLWDILGNMTSSGARPGGSGNLREATKELALTLHDFMGRDLSQEASSLPQRSRAVLESLLSQ